MHDIRFHRHQDVANFEPSRVVPGQKAVSERLQSVGLADKVSHQ